MIGELARMSGGKHLNTVRVLRYISQNCHVSNINALFKASRCPSCDHFKKTAHDLEEPLTTCKEKVKYIFPKNVYELRETLFDKIDSFNFPYSDDQKLLMNMEIFDFQSICVQKDNFRDTDKTVWIGKHVPISVSISSNLIEQAIFLCNSNPTALVESFVDVLDGLATQGTAQVNIKFLGIETSVKTIQSKFLH